MNNVESSHINADLYKEPESLALHGLRVKPAMTERKEQRDAGGLIPLISQQHGCCVNPRAARGEHSGVRQDVAKHDVCYLSAQDALRKAHGR